VTFTQSSGSKFDVDSLKFCRSISGLIFLSAASQSSEKEIVTFPHSAKIVVRSS